MNPVNCLFKFGNYQVFRLPETRTFNIYYVVDVQMELMVPDFSSLADAIKFLRNI